MWRIADSAWLYVVYDPGRAGEGLVTLAVANLDETIAAIEQRGLSAAARETIEGAGRKVEITDPAGNRITFVEVDHA